MTTWVVVGGDGLIGGHLAGLSGRVPWRVLPTTRREPPGEGRLFADLEGGRIGNVLAARPDVAFICAAVTSMQRCRENPAESYRINVTETVNLAERLIGEGAFVIFLSSNTVFDGLTPFPGERDARRPANEYGRQKARAEEELIGLPLGRERAAIVRLSKVLSPKKGIAADFLRRLRSGEECTAFQDLRMSPVSLPYVTRGLTAIAQRKLPGIFHLSGGEEMSYAEFAARLAVRIGADPELVRAVPYRSTGAEVLFSPRFPALGMTETGESLHLDPETADQVLDGLLAESA